MCEIWCINMLFPLIEFNYISCEILERKWKKKNMGILDCNSSQGLKIWRIEKEG